MLVLMLMILMLVLNVGFDAGFDIDSLDLDVLNGFDIDAGSEWF